MKNSLLKKIIAVSLALTTLMLAGCNKDEPVTESLTNPEFMTHDRETKVEEDYEESVTLATEEHKEQSTTQEITETTKHSEVASSEVELSTTQEDETNVRQDVYKIIYNENGEISGIDIKLYGKYDSTKTKSEDTICLFINTKWTEVGTNKQNQKFRSERSAGYTWDFNPVTKEGCLELFSNTQTEFDDGTAAIFDGFPQKQEPYSDAVQTGFTDEYVIISLLLDEPVNIEGKNFRVYMHIDEDSFVTYDGIGNDDWEDEYSKEVSQPDIDLTPTMEDIICRITS